MTATQRKPYKGIAMEGPIATWYSNNTRNDTGRFRAAAAVVAARTAADALVLEVAPGPGYLAIEIARSGRRVTTLDISRSFVRIARENAAKAGVAIDSRHGSASNMPFAANSFEYVISMAAFKNFADPLGALNEMHRVLAPGGEACIYDLRKDATREEIAEEVARMGLSPFNALITRAIFRFGLLKRAYTRAQIEQLAAASRFGRCEIDATGIGFELRLGKAA